MSAEPTPPTYNSPGAASLSAASDADTCAPDFAADFWRRLLVASGWHPEACAQLPPVAAALAATPINALKDDSHPFWSVAECLQILLTGYQPELGKGGTRLLDELTATLTDTLATGWTQTNTALTEHCAQEVTRQQRIEQRLIDSALGQLRAQRARQQATQLLNRAMAGKKLAPAVVEWLQSDWFGELQRCLLQQGDEGDAWQRRAETTLLLVASLQPPTEENGGRQWLYTQIPRVSAGLRQLLSERAHDPAGTDAAMALIEQQHLQLLKGQAPTTAPFRLLSADNTWFADISLSREMLARTQALAPGQWFLLKEDNGDRRIKLILKQDESGQLLFVNQLGIKALQTSIEEFAYCLSAEMVLPLPLNSPARAVFAEALAAREESLRASARQAAEDTAALLQRREEVRQRVEAEARQRALARAKAAAEAQALAKAQAEAEAAAAQQLAEDEAHARAQEQLRRQQALAGLAGDESLRQRLARQQATMLTIGHWVELHDEKGCLQRLKLAVKLQTSGRLIFVDREGVRRADLTRDQLIAALLAGSARIAEQGPQFEDTLARVVDGLRRDRGLDNSLNNGLNNGTDTGIDRTRRE